MTPGTRRLRLRRYGVPVEWDEEPFEWVRPRSFGVLRRYAAGPVSEMRVLTLIEPDGDAHSRVRYEVTARPRNLLGNAAIPLEVGLISARRFRTVFERYAREAHDAAQRALPDYARQSLDLMDTPARLPAGGRERMERVRAALCGRFDAQLVDRLLDVVVRADAMSAARLRPFMLADTWAVPRRDVVQLCLHATRAGLLDLQWDVLCPMCRGAKQSSDSLQGVSQPVHCDACNIDFFANFEQQVELTFRPNEAMRAIDVFPYCVGGPQLTPHIVAQQMVAAASTETVRIGLEAGQYRIRSAGLAASSLFSIDTAGDHDVALTNESDQRRLMIVERMAWNDQALTAAEVIAMQEFRDLFSAEALRPGEAINVGSMAILFTDLVDSTRMYRSIGDAPAFGRVMDHFAVLRTAMQEEEGALVKTIGDAVMAVFRRPAAAIRTVLRAQQLLASLPEGVRPPNLKAGIHFGPCIAVTLNERLDYFGSTVNIAARLDGLSRGGEIVISENVADDPEVMALLRESHVITAPFEAKLKGYEDTTVRLLRVMAGEKG